MWDCKNWLHGDGDFSSVGTGTLEDGMSLPSEALLHVSCLCVDHGSNIIRKPLRVDMGKWRYLLLSSEDSEFGSSPLFNPCLSHMWRGTQGYCFLYKIYTNIGHFKTERWDCFLYHWNLRVQSAPPAFTLFREVHIWAPFKACSEPCFTTVCLPFDPWPGFGTLYLVSGDSSVSNCLSILM